MQITKKDLILYLNCKKSFWLSKKDSEHYPKDTPTDFAKKLWQDWQKVRSCFQETFRIKGNDTINFQKTFETDDGLFAKVHGFEINSEGKACLYEVNSSKSIQNDSEHNHLKKACFQMIVAEKSGQKIDCVIVVHVNGDYVRDGDISPTDLIKSNDVTADVRAIEQETSNQINDALSFLSQDDINRDGCECIYKSRGHHCNAFKYFNPDVPNAPDRHELSIYNLPNLSENKRLELIQNNMIDLHDVPADYQLTKNPKSVFSKLVLWATHARAPQVDEAAIATALSLYQYPLYFFDYETYDSAVPMINGTSPYTKLPVQYSLHIMQEDGTLTHKEFLQREARFPLNLVEQMETDFGEVGSILIWSKFERTQNNSMAKWFPDKADFLNNINSRLVDLEEIFKKHHLYVDARFGGLTSIKKVLPVICPRLTYDGLDVQDGTDAMEVWEKMILNPDTAEEHATNLLAYCKMDTLAMVEIYKFLKAL